MKDYKIFLISFVLFIFMIGAVSASDDASSLAVSEESTVGDLPDLPQIIPGGDPVLPGGDPVSATVDTKDIYVNDTGNDSNVGSAQSPYATIGKAVSDVNASNAATIHIGEGTFLLDSSLSINLDHKSFGGSLVFIGAGVNKTFIDGEASFYFANIGSNANVTLKDLTISNCKNNNGGTIVCNGNLTVDNCVFKNSYATSNKGGVIRAEGSVTQGIDFVTGQMYEIRIEPVIIIKNSEFISSYVNSGKSSTQGGSALYIKNSYLYLENNTFIDTKLSSKGGAGVSIYSATSKSYLINNKFINLTAGSYDASIYMNPGNDNEVVIAGNEFINCSNPSTTYSIVYLGRGNYVFENNTFINSNNSVGNVYALGNINKLIFEIDDAVINITNNEVNNGIEIPFNVTDNMGNIVKTTAFDIKFANDNNEYTFTPTINDNVAKINIASIPENGIYNLTFVYNNGKSSSDVLTTVNISTSNDPVELYVSPKGSDENKGTADSPFATIKHAMDVGFDKSFTVVVHLLKGTYSGAGNVELGIYTKGNLKLIGEKYDETVIDGNNTNWFMHVSTTNVDVENLKFINGNSNSNLLSGSTLFLKDCIVDENQANYVMSDISFDNLVYTNNKGTIYYSRSNSDSGVELIISNGYFANNDNSEMDYGVIFTQNFNTIVENCTFINNTAKTGAAIYPYYGLTSRNNKYIGNVALEKAVIYMKDMDHYNFVFENDTFIDNKATSGYFGVTGCYPTSGDEYCNNLNFVGCKFINNSASEGGAIGLKQGSITNCDFINNTADYGGAIAIIPIGDFYGGSYNEITFDNVVFENNVAINGKDLYFDESKTPEDWYKVNFVRLTINFNDANVTSLVDTLTANVTGPCGAVVGGGIINFVLNGTKIGFSEIENGVASVKYSGFEEGTYQLSGNSDYAYESSAIINGTITVKLEGILDSVEYWVSASGSDENGTGNQSNPFASINHALDVATKNSRNITIHIGEGNYAGDLNTGLTLSAMNNITLIGQGIDKTIIDGKNTTYFAKVTEGKNKVVISDLTIKNMLPDNRDSKIIDSATPITIDEGANLELNNVELSDNHGGEAIIANNGKLTICNSVIARNGLSSNGIIVGGNVIIDNSAIFDNYIKIDYMLRGIIVADSITVNNTVFKGNYILFNNPTSPPSSAFVLIRAYGVVIENSNISSGGNNESLKDLGFSDESISFNPALTVTGPTNMTNTMMVYDFEGTIYTQEGMSQLVYPSALNDYGAMTSVLNVYNSSFINFRYAWMVNGYADFKYNFDGCVFENLTYLAHSRTIGEESQFNITNSVLLFDGDVVLNQQRFQDIQPPCVNFNDNYWGNNSKPVVYFLGNSGIKEETYSPETWITLYSEDEQTVIKNVTDGVNSTAYLGNAPIRTDYADNKGALDYAVVFGPVGYLFTTDDEKNVIFNPEEAIYPFVAADPMDYRTPTAILITGFEGDLGVIGILVDIVGNPIANATITSTFGNLAPVNTTTDANGTFTVKAGKNGVLNIVFAGDNTYFGCEGNMTFVNAGKTAKTYINLNEVKDDMSVTGVLVDDEGTPIANAAIKAVINGNETVNTTTDASGAFTIQGESSCVIDISFEGDDVYNPSNATITLNNLAPKRAATVIEGNNYTQNAIEYKLGERGGNFTVQLKDASGKPLANKTVLIGYNGKCLERTTDENGYASVQINLASENRLTFAVAFLGDENYDATMSVYLITITKKAVTISAPDKTYKASAKTKSYTVTLSTVKGVDGKTYFGAGKKVTLKVDGKTYTAKTNDKGQATFKLNMAKKGTFKATVSFAGDGTYQAATKTSKIKIN